jgi:hypothetical protein
MRIGVDSALGGGFSVLLLCAGDSEGDVEGNALAAGTSAMG